MFELWIFKIKNPNTNFKFNLKQPKKFSVCRTFVVKIGTGKYTAKFTQKWPNLKNI